MNAGGGAKRQLDRAQSKFDAAEGKLEEANEAYNEIAAQLRAQQVSQT